MAAQALTLADDDDWPRFSNGFRAVARWTSPDASERVVLIRRDDGLLTFEVQNWSTDCEYCGPHWTSGNPFGSLFDSEEAVLNEAAAAHPWIHDAEPDRRSL